MLGLDLEHLAIDGCTTKALCGGEVAGLLSFTDEGDTPSSPLPASFAHRGRHFDSENSIKEVRPFR
jgi:hypothetical protein